MSSYIEERPWWPVDKPKQRKKEGSERLRAKSNQIKFIDPRFEKWRVVGFGTARRRLDIPYIACSSDEG